MGVELGEKFVDVFFLVVVVLLMGVEDVGFVFFEFFLFWDCYFKFGFVFFLIFFFCVDVIFFF